MDQNPELEDANFSTLLININIKVIINIINYIYVGYQILI